MVKLIASRLIESIVAIVWIGLLFFGLFEIINKLNPNDFVGILVSIFFGVSILASVISAIGIVFRRQGNSQFDAFINTWIEIWKDLSGYFKPAGKDE